jgi:hypothetical protein
MSWTQNTIEVCSRIAAIRSGARGMRDASAFRPAMHTQTGSRTQRGYSSRVHMAGTRGRRRTTPVTACDSSVPTCSSPAGQRLLIGCRENSGGNALHLGPTSRQAGVLLLGATLATYVLLADTREVAGRDRAAGEQGWFGKSVRPTRADESAAPPAVPTTWPLALVPPPI